MPLRAATQSIFFRLALLGVCMILIGSTIRFFILSHFLREDMTAVVSAQQMTLANYVANDIGHKILTRQFRLQQLGDSLPAPAPGIPVNYVDPTLGQSAPFEALFSAGLLLSTADGRALLDTTTFDWSGSPLQFLPQAALNRNANESSHIGKPVQAGREGPILPMTRVLHDTMGTPWAYLTGFTFLNSPDFLGNLLQARLGQTGSGFLLISPQNQLFVAASNPGKVLTPTPKPGVNLLHDQAMQGYRGTGVTVNAHGIEEISAIVSVPNTNWFLVSAIATSEALGTVERLKAYLLRNTVLTVIFLFLALALVVPFTLRPLTNATRQAEKMSRGLAPLAPLSGAGRGEVGILITAFNRLLDKLNEQQAELSRAANHDSLTGLPNRRLLADRLESALATARRNGTAIALLFIDLDQFKPINDSLGHDAGDAALQRVAQRLSRHVRESDSVARLGGDEFVILLTHLNETSARHAVEGIAGHLMTAISEPFDINGTACSLGISIGAVISDGTHNKADLMRWADQLMYQAKDAGRGRCVIENAPQCAANATA